MRDLPPWVDAEYLGSEPAERDRPPAELLPLDQATLEELALSRDSFLVYPLIASEGVSALSAEAGVGKSGLVLDVAMHLVFGYRDWHGERIDDPRPRRVLLVDAENPPRIVARRIIAWLRHHGEDTEEAWDHLQRHLVYVRKPEFKLGTGNLLLLHAFGWMFTQLKRLDSEAEQFDLVILDNLMALMKHADINDAAIMSAVVEECGLLSERHQIPLLMEAHPPKNSASDRQAMLNGKRPGKTSLISGSQTSVNWVNAACMLAQGNATNERVLGQGKARDGAPMDRVIWFDFGDQDLNIGTDGGGHSLAISRLEFEAVTVESDMERFATWLREAGHTSINSAALRKDMTMPNGCPFGQKRAMDLATKPELKDERYECGVMAEQKMGQKGGSPGWRVWWVSDDAPFVPELGEAE